MGRRVFGAVALFALLTGCAVDRASDTTRAALRDAGHDVTAVGYVYDVGTDVVAVTWQPRATTPEDLRVEGDAVARVVWERSPLRVDAVDLVRADHGVPGVLGVRSRRIGRAELEAAYGPRKASLDDESVGGVVEENALAAVATVAVAFAGLGLVAIVVTVRQSRRRAPLPPVTAS